MRRFSILALVALIAFFTPTSTSYLSDSEGTSGYFKAEESVISPDLSFYFGSEEKEVGFTVDHIKDFDRVDYEIIYARDGGLAEGILGSIDNSSADDSITREWITLGTCSSGGACVYHNIEGSIDLTVDLYKDSVLIETLTTSI